MFKTYVNPVYISDLKFVRGQHYFVLDMRKIILDSL